MLDFAVQLTKTVCNVTEKNITPLKNDGFSDSAILDIVQVISYFNFVNRLACGLGVELEDFYKQSENYAKLKQQENNYGTNK